MLTAAVEQVVAELPEDFSWTKPLPLTSRKLTGPLVKAAIGLPNTGSKEETLQRARLPCQLDEQAPAISLCCTN